MNVAFLVYSWCSWDISVFWVLCWWIFLLLGFLVLSGLKKEIQLVIDAVPFSLYALQLTRNVYFSVFCVEVCVKGTISDGVEFRVWFGIGVLFALPQLLKHSLSLTWPQNGWPVCKTGYSHGRLLHWLKKANSHQFSILFFTVCTQLLG